MVGLLPRLDSGLFISSADSNRHGLQSGPTKREPLAGQWGLDLYSIIHVIHNALYILMQATKCTVPCLQF